MNEQQVALSTRPLYIHAFPAGSDHWRVDWFGPVAFPNRLMRSNQPSVLVYLSRVGTLKAFTEPTRPPWSHVKVNVKFQERQFKCWVSVGQLMLLRVGDIWRDRTLVMSPPYQSGDFKDIEVAEGTTEVVKAGVSLADRVFLLPLDEHPGHGENTRSHCLRVLLGGERSIVVPCMELIRFYFGSSSALLSRLFDPTLKKEKLFSNLTVNRKSGWMRIRLADGIPKASASDVARIAGSYEAWKSVLKILSSCMTASLSKKDVYPQSHFPFEGTTNLKATGIWLPLAGRSQQTFLVYHLDSCSHPFPFSSLRYEVSDMRGSLWPTGHASQQLNAKPRVVKKTEKAMQPILVDKDASSTLSQTQVSTHRTQRFPDLERKSRVGQRALTNTLAPTASAKKSAQPVNEMAVGEGTSTNRVRSVLLSEAERLLKPSLPAFLAPVVESIDSLVGYQINLLTASDVDGWTVPVEMLNDDDGVIPDELFIERDDHQQQRRAAAFGLSRSDSHTILVVIENHRLIPLLYPISPEGLNDPWPTIKCATQDFVAKVRNPEKDEVVADIRLPPDASSELLEWLQELTKRFACHELI